MTLSPTRPVARLAVCVALIASSAPAFAGLGGLCGRLRDSVTDTLWSDQQRPRRILEPLSTLATQLQQFHERGRTKPEDLIFKGLRYPLMQLDAMFKLYAKTTGDSFDRAAEDVARLSDASSAYTDALVIRFLAEKTGAPAATIEHLTRRETKAREAFTGLLEMDGWLGKGDKNPIERCRDALVEYEWDAGKADREYVRKRFIKSLEKIQNETYDVSVMEEGVHRFRRHMRLVIIQMSSLRGGVFGDAMRPSKPEYESTLTDVRILTKRYAAFVENPLISNPIRVSKSLLLRAVQLIESIGVTKDIALSEEAMAKALVKSGAFSRASAEDALAYAKDLVAAYPEFQDYYATDRASLYDAAAIYKEFREEIIPRLIAELEAAAPLDHD